MLYAQFYVGEDRFVISASSIVEIIPCVSMKLAPTLPDYVAGLINYHGSPSPVIDVCHLLLSRPSRKKLSTRIIMIEGNVNSDQENYIGFMVEKSTEMLTLNEAEFKDSAIKNPDVPMEGDVINHQGVLITRISVEDVIEKLDKRFFQEDIFPVSASQP